VEIKITELPATLNAFLSNERFWGGWGILKAASLR